MQKVVLIILLFVQTGLSGQQPQKFTPVANLSEVEEKLIAQSQKTNSIISDFSQKKHITYIDEIIEAKGKFWFRKENNLRWEYTSPYEYIIAIYQGKFFIKDDGKVSEFDIESNKAFQQVNDLIIKSVRGTLLEGDEFHVRAFENVSAYKVKLTPKNPDIKEVLNQVELYFNKSDLAIYKVKMVESEQDYTTISFHNRQINEEVPSHIFIID